MPIVKLDDVKQYAGIELDEARANATIKGVSKLIEDYTGRIFGEVREISETHDFAPTVFLSHVDITKLIEVKLNGENITDKCSVNKHTGRLVISRALRDLPTSRSGYDAIEVKYLCGMEEVPMDLQMATLQLIMDNYNRKDGKDAGVSSLSIGSYHINYGNQSNTGNVQANALSGASSPITDYMSTLNFYRVRSL